MAASALLFATMNFSARVASGHLSWMLVVSVRAFVGTAVAIAVARARGTSPSTIANQLASIFKKLGVGSRFELIASLR